MKILDSNSMAFDTTVTLELSYAVVLYVSYTLCGRLELGLYLKPDR